MEKKNGLFCYLVFAMWVVVAFVAGPAHAEVRYTLTDLGTMGGTHSAAAGINNAGQVVGHTYDANWAVRHGFLWQNGTMTDLGTLFGGKYSRAYAINNVGQVVGDSWTYFTNPNLLTVHAFLWKNGVMTDIGPGGRAGKSSSGACAINDAGQAVGTVKFWSGPYTHAYILSGQYAGTNLGNWYGISGHSSATSINNAGQVVGSSNLPNDTSVQHAVLWNGLEGMTDLGVLPGSTLSRSTISEARCINNAGQVVGSAVDALGTTHAILWADGTMNDLATLPGVTRSSAYGINNVGQIVGFAGSIPGANNNIAVLWDGGVMIDLNSLIAPGSSLKLVDANAINDMGQIVGVGTIGDKSHAFLLTPVVQ